VVFLESISNGGQGVLLQPADALLVTALVHAVWTDLRVRRISNRMTYPMMALGLTLHWASGGMAGLVSSASGLLFGGAALLLPYALGAMGLGDAKLLAVIGALKGPWFALHTLAYGCIAGGVLALVYLLRDRHFIAASAATMARWVGGDRGRKTQHALIASTPGRYSSRMHITMPYAPALALGALFALTPYLTPLFQR
jgi:Flp pilus assembly protein protease CpaA